jgi:hypothetical protein
MGIRSDSGTKRDRPDSYGEPFPKRPEIEAPEEPLDFDEDEDASDFGDEEDDFAYELPITAEDFKRGPDPVDVTEEQLEKFRDGFEAVQQEWAAAGAEILVVGNPCEARPVPQSAEDFKERLAYFKLDSIGAETKAQFAEKLDEAMFAEEEVKEEEEDDETEDEAAPPKDEKKDDKPPVNNGKEVMALLKEYLTIVQSQMEKSRLAQAVQTVVVLTHGLLDAELDDLCETPELTAEFSAFLTGLATVWKSILAKDNAELAVDAASKRGAEALKGLIRTAVDDESFLGGKVKGAFDA